MELPIHAAVALGLIVALSLITAKPGKGLTFLFILLLGLAGGPTIIKSVAGEIEGREAPTVGLK